MNVVLVSHFLNEHLEPLCDEFKHICDDFCFVSTSKKIDSGYQHEYDKDYVIHLYRNEEKEKAYTKIEQADVVIFGGCPNELVEYRMKTGKLTFVYTERFFKRGNWRRFSPSVRKAIFERIVQYKDKNLFILAASAYLPDDLAYFGFPKSKCYRWGYFPRFVQYDDINKVINKKDENSLLWVARQVWLKHPETALRVMYRLKKKGYSLRLAFVGAGPIEGKMRKLVKFLNLSEDVQFLGYMSPQEVRNKMENSKILLFTSNRMEGWGAVVNEGMNSGCVVVSSTAAGATEYIIQDGKNGFSYTFNDINALCRKIETVLKDRELSYKVAQKAYETIENEWSPRVAATRFLQLVNDINKNHDSNTFSSGPCSKVERE